jgi:hemolysin type calcium-binding protein
VPLSPPRSAVRADSGFSLYLSAAARYGDRTANQPRCYERPVCTCRDTDRPTQKDMEIMITLNYRRAATSLAVVASVVLSGGLASPQASAAPDDNNPIPDPEMCFLQVPGAENRCVPACDGQAPTIAVPPGGGSFYPDAGLPQVIIGTNGDDRIFAAGDDDIICGLGGIDTIWGGGGEDRIFGGDDPDQIYGDEDDDFLVGGAGDDVLDGSENDDTMWGSAGDDYFDCDAGADTVDGGPGFDSVVSNGNCASVTRVENP